MLVQLEIALVIKMEKKVNVRQALVSFNSIRERGVYKDGTYALDGIRAAVGFDGYTVSLSNDHVSLDIFFHNKFSLQYTNRRELELFMDKICRMATRA